MAGGMESMTRAPPLLLNSRAGYKYGPVTVEDSMALDGLTDAFDHLSMGESTERSGRELGITREQQDEFAAMSHQRAAAAAKNGLFAAEIAAVPVPQHKGETLMVTEDEGIRPGTTAETLAKLKPAFSADGTITAGTASQISDGAAAVVVTSAEYAERAGLNVIAVLDHQVRARGHEVLLLGLARAVANQDGGLMLFIARRQSDHILRESGHFVHLLFNRQATLQVVKFHGAGGFGEDRESERIPFG